jgi:hypothetical protein
MPRNRLTRAPGRSLRGAARCRPRSSAPARAAAPRRRARSRRGSSSSRPVTASVSAPGSPGGTRTPVSSVMTSRYPVMSDATTGIAHANPRVSTIPKLSPPSDGATSALALSSSSVRSSWLTNPSASIPSSLTPARERVSRTISGSAPINRRRAPVRRWISGQARSSTGMPLRGSCLPTKTIRFSRPPASA